MTLLIQDVAVMIYQQDHKIWLSRITRDKTVAMTLPDINGNISPKNGDYYIILESD
jgi:predicted transcriptional regulator